MGVFNLLKPLFLVSEDVGATWTHWELKSSGSLNSSSCHDQHCMLGGNVFTSGYSSEPFFLTSHDSGMTWSPGNKLPDFPTGMTADFATVHCGEKFCIAVGELRDHAISDPLLLKRNHADDSWSMGSYSDLPKNYMAALHDVSCQGNDCIVVGSSKVGLMTTLPLIMTTKDQGETWHYVKNITNNPSRLFSAGLSTLHCNDDYCLASGQGDSSTKTPLIYISSDKGASWSYVKKYSALPKSIESVEIDKLTCLQNFCVAVGASIKHAMRHPFLMNSNDHGYSWTYVDMIPDVHDEKNIGAIKGLTCEQDTCIAAGSYATHKLKERPIFVISHDKGKNWSVIKNVMGFPAHYDYNTLRIEDVICSSSNCMALGKMYHPDGNFPLLMISRDSGQNWMIQALDKLPKTSELTKFGKIN